MSQRITYSPAGNTMDRYAAESPDLAKVLQAKADIGADFWRSNSVVDTGYNSQSVVTYLDVIDGVQTAIVHAFGYYAKWREIGTRHNRPERVMTRSITVMENT